MKYILQTILLFTLAFFTRAGYSQDPSGYSFSLEEAMDFAVNNSTNNENARLDLEIARKEVWKTLATGLPQANGSYDYQHLPGELPVLSFPDGSGGMREVTLGVKNSATYNVTVSQLLFSGEYIVGLQASRTFVEQSKNAEEKTAQDTKEVVASAYFTVLVLRNNLSILDSSVNILKETLEETRAMVAAGFMEDTDAEQIQVSLNSLINSRSAIERQEALAVRLLKIQLGLSARDSLELTDEMDMLMNEEILISPLQQEFILEENIDFRSIETQEQLSRQMLRREQARFLPTVSGFYLYQDRTNKPDFDITFNHILGINVSVPIFSSGQRLASVSQAKIELEKIRNTRENLEETLLMGYDQARTDYLNAMENFEVDRQNIELAQKIYDKTLARYQEGMASSMDVSQANSQYLDSHASLTNTMLELFNAKIRLQKVINEL